MKQPRGLKASSKKELIKSYACQTSLLSSFYYYIFSPALLEEETKSF
jgi:hypothetical protein